MATVQQAVGGVSFALTDEQRELRALAREFAAKEIRPKAALYDVAMRHPADVIEQARDAGVSRDPFRRFDLRCVALAVTEAECVHGEALVLRDREHGGRIESAAEQEDGGRSSGGRFQRRGLCEEI
jgi:hypothetical protein